MNKKILALCAFMLLAVVLSAQTVQPKKQKIKVEGRANASLYMTEVYKTDNWAEYYLRIRLTKMKLKRSCMNFFRITSGIMPFLPSKLKI